MPGVLMHKKRAENPRIRRILHIALFLALAGAIISAYILVIQLYGIDSMCRAGPCDCNEVIRSPQSNIAGLPSALLSLAVNLLVVLMTAILLRRTDQHAGRGLDITFMALFLAGFVYMTYFTYIQAYAIRTWCLLHIALYIIITALLALSVANYAMKAKK